MQKLETRNATLLFFEVPEIALPYTKGLFIHSLEWLDKGGTLENYPFSELDKCKEYEIVGEVTKKEITFDCKQYLTTNHDRAEYTFRAWMEWCDIYLTEGNKFVVLKEKT